MHSPKTLTCLLVLTFSPPVIAIPVYWDMGFLDGEGAQVGSASFYYDDETRTPTFTYGNPSYSYSTQSSTTTNLYSAVEGFEGYIEGVGELNPVSGLYWFDDNAGIAAGTTGPTKGGGGSSPQWLFNYSHEDFIETYTLSYGAVLDFWDRDNDALAVTYDGSTVSGGQWSRDFSGGSWIANKRISSITAVPIPATLPLFGLGLAGLMWLSSRQRSHKSRNLNVA